MLDPSAPLEADTCTHEASVLTHMSCKGIMDPAPMSCKLLQKCQALLKSGGQKAARQDLFFPCGCVVSALEHSRHSSLAKVSREKRVA